MSSVFIFVLSVVGLWLSVYFTGVYYKWTKPEVFWIPRVCQMEEASCMLILDTPRAKMFGLPNSVFGIFLYLYLIAAYSFFPVVIALAVLGFAVLRSLYLAYSLIFITKVPCPLCFTAHVINLILFITVFKIHLSG